MSEEAAEGRSLSDLQILTHVQVGLVGGNPGSELGAQSEGRLLQHFDFELLKIRLLYVSTLVHLFTYISRAETRKLESLFKCQIQVAGTEPQHRSPLSFILKI